MEKKITPDNRKKMYIQYSERREDILKALRRLRRREARAIRREQRAEKKLRQIREKIVTIEEESDLKAISKTIAALASKRRVDLGD